MFQSGAARGGRVALKGPPNNVHVFICGARLLGTGAGVMSVQGAKVVAAVHVGPRAGFRNNFVKLCAWARCWRAAYA